MPYSDRAEQNFYAVEWKKQRRVEWVRAQKQCADCGLVTQQLFVYWTGVGGKPKTIWGLSEFRRTKLLAKCVAVCKPCANKRRWANAEIQHGTLNAYKHHGCRCELCRTENARRVQAQRLVHPRRRALADQPNAFAGAPSTGRTEANG